MSRMGIVLRLFGKFIAHMETLNTWLVIFTHWMEKLYAPMETFTHDFSALSFSRFLKHKWRYFTPSRWTWETFHARLEDFHARLRWRGTRR